MQYTIEELTLKIEQAEARKKSTRKEYEEALVTYKDLRAKLLEYCLERDTKRLGLESVKYEIASVKALRQLDSKLTFRGKEVSLGICYNTVIDKLIAEYNHRNNVSCNYKAALLLMYEYPDCSKFSTTFRNIDKWFYELFREKLVSEIELLK